MRKSTPHPEWHLATRTATFWANLPALIDYCLAHRLVADAHLPGNLRERHPVLV